MQLKGISFMKIAICDDEKIAREKVVTLLEDYFHDRKRDIPYEVFERYPDLEKRIDEFNIFLLMIKTSLTGEYDFSGVNPYIGFFAWMLFISGVLLGITAAVILVLYISGKCFKNEVPIRLFWSILILTGVFFMLRLMITVPNFSSGDMRYIAWITVPLCMMNGMYLSDGNAGWKGWKPGGAELFIIGESIMFVIASMGVYYLLGMP